MKMIQLIQKIIVIRFISDFLTKIHPIKNKQASRYF